MTYQDLIVAAADLKCEESRARLEAYFEIVLKRADLEAAEDLLRGYFGKPAKPAGQLASPEIVELMRPYGGVRPAQTVYFRAGADAGEFAFIWPWSDGVLTTLKIMTEKKRVP
jgi:hypothetical protein